MQKIFLCLIFLRFALPAFPQNPKEFTNTFFLKQLNNDSSYTQLKRKVIAEFTNAKPGEWGEFVFGVDEELATQRKVIAFTFDACGGKNGNGYDKELIDLLRSENIPATFFISGKWIDANFNTFVSLNRDTLFEIENHGLNHKPSSLSGESAYGIHGTANVGEAFDEIEANALKIKAITNNFPHLYRSATTYIDEACVQMAGELGITAVSFHVLSGDAVPFASDSLIEKNVIQHIRPGAIIIMHLNHPEWNTYEAMKKIIPKLRQMGYTFVKLNGFELISDRIKLKKN